MLAVLRLDEELALLFLSGLRKIGLSPCMLDLKKMYYWKAVLKTRPLDTEPRKLSL